MEKVTTRVRHTLPY